MFALRNDEEKDKNSIGDTKIDVNFEEDEKMNLIIVRFKNPISLELNNEYKITISGIKNFIYVDKSEKYNIHNNLYIENNNDCSIILGIII